MSTIDEEDVLRRFDTLVSQGEIKWTQSEPVNRTVSDFEFEYRVVESFAKKPQLSNSSSEDESEEDDESEEPRVKSDIRNDGPLFDIAKIGPSHELVLNRYSVYRPQYILLTKNPVHDQHEPLDRADIAAALILLHTSPSPIFVIYNCGELAGCSRSHRHMQAFPSPGTKANTAKALFPDRVQDIDTRSIPFKYYLSRFPASWLENAKATPSDKHADEVVEMYRDSLEKARRILKISEGEHIPHNVILVKEWLMVIPRQGGKVGGSAVNAASMMGMVWTKSQKELDAWERLSIDESLAKFGVPTDTPDD